MLDEKLRTKWAWCAINFGSLRYRCNKARLTSMYYCRTAWILSGLQKVNSRFDCLQNEGIPMSLRSLGRCMYVYVDLHKQKIFIVGRKHDHYLHFVLSTIPMFRIVKTLYSKTMVKTPNLIAEPTYLTNRAQSFTFSMWGAASWLV
jgi:hypothetical protein